MGCERYYLMPQSIIAPEEVPSGWGLLEVHGKQVLESVRADSKKRRIDPGVMAEMELLLASLRRVEVRIEPQTITEFLKWKNRMAEYNGGRLPRGLAASERELLS